MASVGAGLSIVIRSAAGHGSETFEKPRHTTELRNRRALRNKNVEESENIFALQSLPISGFPDAEEGVLEPIRRFYSMGLVGSTSSRCVKV